MGASKMMRRMAKKKSVVASGKRRLVSVFKGTKLKTSGGLTKADLKKSKTGRIVSKKRSEASKKSKGGKVIAKWGVATKAARRALGIKGFRPVGGKSKQGQAL